MLSPFPTNPLRSLLETRELRFWFSRVQKGEETPEFAELLLVYGRALLENAIAQSSVLGPKEKEGEAPAEAAKDGASGAGEYAFLDTSRSPLD